MCVHLESFAAIDFRGILFLLHFHCFLANVDRPGQKTLQNGETA